MAELLHLSPKEATAVRLSLRIAFWAMPRNVTVNLNTPRR